MEKYSSGLVEESFWFVEFKQFIKLLSEGRTWVKGCRENRGHY